MKTKKKMFNLDNHPNKVSRKADLDPEQAGLLRITKQFEEKKRTGDEFEENVSLKLKEVEGYLFDNIYFETGNYISRLFLYESIQIDHILATREGVFCIEDKWLDDNKYVQISGGAQSNSWKLQKYKGTSTTEINGLKQNYRHKIFLDELFEFNGIEVPVYQITVIGGVLRDKIKMQQFIDANLVDEEELLDKINYLKSRNKEEVNISKVKEIIEEWRCKDKAVEKQHLVYCRHIKDKKLPAKCKIILRTN